MEGRKKGEVRDPRFLGNEHGPWVATAELIGIIAIRIQEARRDT
jgi:hypothetical protein